MKELRDSNGFYVMNVKTSSDEKPKKKKEKNHTKIPATKIKKLKSLKFKKGTRKYELNRKMIEFAVPGCVHNFTDTTANDVTLMRRKGNFEALIHHGASDSYLADVEKAKEGYVFIDMGGCSYLRVPIDVYRKMLTIHRVGISFRLRATSDDMTYAVDGEESMIVTEYDRVIDSVNELCKVYSTERTRIETVCDLYATDFWYHIFEYDYRILVHKVNGDYKYFKDINDLCKWLGLSMI